jgi:predicted ester cyclase
LEFNNRNFAAFSEFIANDFIDRTAAQGEEAGLNGLRARMEAIAAELPSLRISIELIFAKGDYVAVVAAARGVTGGAMPADRRIIEYSMIDVWFVRDGKLAELWHLQEQ